MTASRHQTTAYGATGISQAAGTAALNNAQDWQKAFLIHLKKMRGLTLEFIAEMPNLEMVNPNATYLAFPKIIDSSLNSEAFVAALLTKSKVALVPGGKDWFEAIKNSFNWNERKVQKCLQG